MNKLFVALVAIHKFFRSQPQGQEENIAERIVPGLFFERPKNRSATKWCIVACDLPLVVCRAYSPPRCSLQLQRLQRSSELLRMASVYPFFCALDRYKGL